MSKSTTSHPLFGSAIGGMLAAACVLAACGSSGVSEPTEPTIPADIDQIVAKAAQVMGNTTSVRFELANDGAPVYIDQFESIALNSIVGEFTVPRSAQAVLDVQVDTTLNTQLAAIALDDEVWLSNPITGNFETLPPGYDVDPSLFFDPENGWRPLLENLTDVELVGGAATEIDGNSRYHVTATAPAERIEVITARLVRNQDVDIEFWIQPVTGEVRSAEFTATFPDGEVVWSLDLSGYGEEFDISAPEGLES